MKKWYYAQGIGQLYEEIVLVHGNEPVLFVCVDERKQRYLCMAYEPYILRFVIMPISAKTLIEMLENRTPMDQTFRSADVIYTTEENEDENSSVDLILSDHDPMTFPVDHLPKAGEFYELDFEWVKDYIRKLKAEITTLKIMLPYPMPFNKKQSNTIQVVYKTASSNVVYESLLGNNTNVSASYQIKSGESNYSENLPIDFDNRAA